MWGVVGLGGGTALAVLLAATRGSSVTLVVLVLLCGIGGVLACDHALSRTVRRREERMSAEFPTVATVGAPR